ncbi:thioredoxin [Betaproteobacteria bacterium]|nr:thioredoxin [Betaproteobacteria bacterium]GHU44872.1 thioredoxin [Betaproteobacteria bacterium]
MSEETQSGHPVKTTTHAFEAEVLNSDLPVLVDYWAEWCGPCMMMMPALEAVAAEYAGRLKVVKINVDEEGDLGARYHIRGIPTLMLFKNGNIEETRVGAISKSQIIAMIDSKL